MTPASDIEAAAAEWLIRIEGDDSPAIQAQFKAWLAANVRHHATFVRLESVWSQADVLKKLRPLDGGVDENVLDAFGLVRPIAQKSAKRRLRPEATLLLFVIAGVAAWIALARSQWQTYETDLGGFQRISLRDGSTVLLNTSSKISVRFTQTARHIVLARGEAQFTVAHDTSRPFDVEAADTTFRAVGTSFALRLSDQRQVDVIVTEGHVAVDPPDESPGAHSPHSNVTPTLATVAAGETVSVKAHKLHASTVGGADITRRLAWTRGQLSFDRTSLAEAVAEFNRYNRRQLVVADPAIADFQIGGAFGITDLNSFVAALQKFGIRAFATWGQSEDPDSEVIRLVGVGN